MENSLLAAQNRIKNKRLNLIQANKTPTKNSNYISNLFTRTLLSVILVLTSAIYINLNDANLITFNNYFFNETLSFTKINAIYTKYFGSLLPTKLTKNMPVFDPKNNYNHITQIDNSYELKLNSNLFNFLESGVVVFIGEKEGLGKTVIIQGNDGNDIWYSNIANLNLNMYDYIEKGSIVGEFLDQKAILTFIENGNFITYEKYLS